MKRIEPDKQQEKRRGITPRLTLNTPHLPTIPAERPAMFFQSTRMVMTPLVIGREVKSSLYILNFSSMVEIF